jgi:hypothetical protein
LDDECCNSYAYDLELERHSVAEGACRCMTAVVAERVDWELSRDPLDTERGELHEERPYPFVAVADDNDNNSSDDDDDGSSMIMSTTSHSSSSGSSSRRSSFADE